jgi:hypothetical protein
VRVANPSQCHGIVRSFIKWYKGHPKLSPREGLLGGGRGMYSGLYHSSVLQLTPYSLPGAADDSLAMGYVWSI